MHKTWMAKKEESKREWRLIDATDQTLGRLATTVANILRGKNKVEYTPHVDVGDFVVIINSDKIKMSGRKLEQKKYYRHTGFFGGIKEKTMKNIMQEDSTQIIISAVKGMLPNNRLNRLVLKKLNVYKDEEHPHKAQKVTVVSL
ncbi:MAG: 50S ribosomal protein L13 [Bdellovibrionales bacterium]|nr:50S ribosomal protein L13 [Bdellovibrionales bacterium]